MSETTSRPLLITADDRKALEILRLRAWNDIVDMAYLRESLTTPDGRAQHRKRMTSQSVFIPVDFYLTFSVESGEHFVPRLFAEFSQPIRSVNVARPTLDDVFLHLTGAPATDAEEAAA